MSTNENRSKYRSHLLVIIEGAVMAALAVALSFVEIPIGALGGSINITMLPIVIFAFRRGVGPGMLMGLVFGTLKYLMGGVAYAFWSVLLDYPLAYMMVGLAGLFPTKNSAPAWGVKSLVGALGRYAVSVVSGATIYAIAAPSEIWGMTIASPLIYSLLYNLSYLGPSAVIVCALCLLLNRPIGKIPLSS